VKRESSSLKSLYKGEAFRKGRGVPLDEGEKRRYHNEKIRREEVEIKGNGD